MFIFRPLFTFYQAKGVTMKAYQSFSTRKTPQSEPIPGVNQVKNSAGGYIWAINDWKRLERFLILGSEGGTYYIKQRKLTRDNAEAVLRCVKEDGLRVVSTVVEISHSGRAPKNDPALYALAMCLKLGDLETRQAATRALPRVARIGTHLFHFVAFLEQFGGWGRLTKSAIAGWYNGMNASKLAYQVVKYQQRDGWANRDLLRLSHPKPPTDTHNAIYH
jgi:60 kDa SS-A/Ro ribonucleoprotein